MVDAILQDSKKILPCAAMCQGEYGLNDVFVGVPVKLGRQGVEQIVVVSLNADEQAGLLKSAELVKEMCTAVDAMI
jgi:malate dehydrogenase